MQKYINKSWQSENCNTASAFWIARSVTKMNSDISLLSFLALDRRQNGRADLAALTGDIPQKLVGPI
jgi:hypothetical protein